MINWVLNFECLQLNKQKHFCKIKLSEIWTQLLDDWNNLTNVYMYMLVFIQVFSFILGTYYCYDRYYYLKNAGSPDETLGIAPAFAGEFSYYLGLKQTWLAFGKVASTNRKRTPTDQNAFLLHFLVHTQYYATKYIQQNKFDSKWLRKKLVF